MEITYCKTLNRTYLHHQGRLISFVLGDKREDKETISTWEKVINRREERLQKDRK